MVRRALSAPAAWLSMRLAWWQSGRLGPATAEGDAVWWHEDVQSGGFSKTKASGPAITVAPTHSHSMNSDR